MNPLIAYPDRYTMAEMPCIPLEMCFYFKQLAINQGVKAAAEAMESLDYPIQAALGLLVYDSYDLEFLG
jgi:hypothetical protein